MALIAESPDERVQQLLLLTDRLTALVAQETQRMEARLPLLEGPHAEEKARLANAYRLELARVQQEPGRIKAASKPLLDALKTRTQALNQALARHETALNALKLVSEGLMQAIAEEVARQRRQLDPYTADGAVNAAPGPRPAILDRTA